MRLKSDTARAEADPANAQFQRDLSVSYNKMGDLAVAAGDGKAAREAFQRSLEVAKKLAEADPANAQFQRDLSVSFEKMGDLLGREGDGEAAQAAYLQALDAYRRLCERNPDDVQSRVFSVVPLWRLGSLGGPDARRHLNEALSILRPLAAADRLDANRKSWIPQLEKMLADLQ